MRASLVLAAAFVAACSGGVDASRSIDDFAAPGQPLPREDSGGVPTFVRLDPAKFTGLDRSTPERAARDVLHRLRDDYGLEPRDIDTADAFDRHDVGRGPVIVRFRQRHEGLPVFRAELSVAFDRSMAPVAVAGHFAPLPSSREATDPSRVTAVGAMARALSNETHTSFETEAIVLTTGDDGRHHATLRDDAGPWRLTAPILGRPVWFDTSAEIRRGWYVELEVGLRRSTQARRTSFVIDAFDGKILYRHDMSADLATSWRTWAEDAPPYLAAPGPLDAALWPHPLGRPDDRLATFAAPGLVSIDRPWVDDGATETRGNHAEAYTDLVAPDGFTPGTADAFATMTAPGVFDRSYDVTAAPDSDTQRQASTASAFATVNALHDLLSDAGFDEAAGNAQARNFGRGGREGDALKVEVQDSSETNNASMWASSDGERPRLQLHLFDPQSSIVLHSESDGLPPLRTAGQPAAFGPASFDIPASLAVAEPSNACSPLINQAEATGRIVLVARGSGPFIDKARAAQAAGAVGVIVTNNVPGAVGGMTGIAPDVLIPAVIITQDDGDTLRARLALAPVEGRLVRSDWPARDPAIDGTIVAHEWGHLLTRRLVADANGFNTLMSIGLAEGWSDLFSLLVTTHASDARAPGNEGWLGAFAYGTYTALGGGADALYFGLRRVPYSSDPAKNALTFAHLVDGTPLPDVPTAFGADGARNSQVHATGEVWATMLWECFTALARDESRLTFDEARTRMLAYLVASLKLTPADPTLLEARDALLAAAAAYDLDDYRAFGEAFARRGAGTGAVAPARNDPTRSGLVESFTFGPDLRLAGIELGRGPTWCDDDDLVDPGETGLLRVRVTNLGGEVVRSIRLDVSSSAGARFPNGTSSSLNLSPGETRTVDVAVESPVGTPPGLANWSVIASGPAFLGGPRTLGSVWLPWSADVAVESETVETFSVADARWSEGAPSTLSFPVSDGSRWMRIAGSSHPSDVRVVSPALRVSDVEPLTVTFSHRYSFEKDASNSYDGAMLEWSDDDGAAWHDAATALYDSTLSSDTSPLSGRAVWSGRQSAWSPVTIDLGQTLAGRTVRFGWRVACDNAGLSPGWDVDDLRFTGVTNRPFASLVSDPGTACDAHRPIARVSDVEVISGARVTLDGTASRDPDGGALRWHWTLEGVTLPDTDGPRPSFVAPEVTTQTRLSVELVVIDDQGLSSAPAMASVTVRPRPPPETTTLAADTTAAAPDTTLTASETTTTAPETTTVAEGSADAAAPRGCQCASTDAAALALLGSVLGRRRRRDLPPA